jgi:hypothetical protein
MKKIGDKVSKLIQILEANNVYTTKVMSAGQQQLDRILEAEAGYNRKVEIAEVELIDNLNPLSPIAFTLYGLRAGNAYLDLSDRIDEANIEYRISYSLAIISYYSRIDAILADP